mgnify:CR=1 FL=1
MNKILRPNREEQTLARKKVLAHIPKNAIGAEIGVHLGNYADKIINISKPKQFYLIDPWKIVDGNGYDNSLYGKNLTSQEELDDRYKSVVDRFKDFDNVHILREFSNIAAAQIPDDSLDFIYIDGDHTFDGVCKDFDIFYSKIKPYGFIYGDDYTDRHWFGTGVIDALHKNLHEKKLRLVFLDAEQYCCQKA